MTAYIIRFRCSNGDWSETQIVARDNNEATKQARAMYGASNVISVYPAIMETVWPNNG